MEPIKKISINDTEYQIVDETALHDDDMPTTLPNPYALTFTGAATSIYDGSEATTIDIPTVAGVDAHNADSSAHADIREEISQLSSEIEDLKNGENTSYTNVLPLALDSNGTSIYNGIGYKADTSWDDNEGGEPTSPGIYLTGYIPVSKGDVIYCKNIGLQKDTGVTGFVWWFPSLYDSASSSNGEALTEHNSATWHDDGTIASFVVDDDYSYIRIQCQSITEDSEILQNALNVRVAELETKVQDIDTRLVDTEVPGYWLPVLEEGAEAINTALCEAGSNKSAFLFYSDAHWTSGSQKSPLLLKWLYKNTGINKTYFGGDIVDNEADSYDGMKYLWTWRRLLREVPNHHSVVGNHDDGNATNNLFSEKYVYGYLFGPEEENDIVRGGDTYYYYDEKSERTRYIFLDTAYKCMTATQQEFLKQALISTPDMWHIVVISHIWYGPDYDNYNVRPIPIVGLSADATIVTNILDAYNSRIGDYENCGGWVEFCIGGHVHRDYDNTTATGIPIILVETDSSHTRGTYSYEEGSTSEASVNGIIADYDKHKIYVVRIGRGESREVSITTHVLNYTNQLPFALDVRNPSTVLVGDGTVGYLADRRFSSSNGGYVAADGWDVTGLIPVKVGDIVRIKNITAQVYTEVPSNGDLGNISFYLSDYSWNTACSFLNLEAGNSTQMVLDESNNIVQFTIPNWNSDISYFSITCQDINQNSIITVNEEIPETDPGQDTPTYTNVIKTSVGTDGEIFNSGKGWADNSRIGSGGIYMGNQTGEAAQWVTGYIEIDPNIDNTFRLKNVEFNRNSTSIYHGMAFFDASFTRAAYDGTLDWRGPSDLGEFSPAFDSDGNVTEFTLFASNITNKNVKYIAICCSYIGDDSIITINEPIE